MSGRARYRYGPHVAQNARLRSIKRRALWAARSATSPASAHALRRIRWRFVESIMHGEDDLLGLTWLHGGAYRLTIVAREEPVGRDDDSRLMPPRLRRAWRALPTVEATALHELAHAILMPAQGEYRCDGTVTEWHGPAWVGQLVDLAAAYLSAGGPGVVR